MDETKPEGLGETSKKEWPTLSKKQLSMDPIDLLGNPDTHSRVLAYLNDRLKKSELSVGNFYDRWRVNEIKYQAYISLPDWEKQLKEINKAGGPPKAVNIVVPYSFATVMTVVTYLIQTFCGRDPMLMVSTHKTEYLQAARNMETVLQYMSEHTHLVRHMFQYLNDSITYGVSIMRCQWKEDHKFRTRWTATKGLVGLPETWKKDREKRLVYEGNDVSCIDPFMFFPDPRVPMSEVARRGEFVFWRAFEGKHFLLKMQDDGIFKYVDKVSPMAVPTMSDQQGQSARGLLSGGSGSSGSDSTWGQKSDMYRVDQGSVEIIPAELGLGDSNSPKKYIFTWLNGTQIVQCEPLDLDHDMHPVAVSEPYTMGYGFGQPGLLDFSGPMQDLMSWMLNSHVDNVRTVMNNMLVVDPSKIEMQDLKEPGPGKLIRLKRAAYGTDVNSAVKQLAVSDVTGGHMNDFSLLMRLSDMMSATSDNIRGQQDSGGRKTATEVRTSLDAGTSRLASLAKRISSQGMVDLTEMMSLNTQQLLSDEFFMEIVGPDKGPIKITPQTLVGDFNFPINDGTLPIDKVAMLDVWKEILMGVMQDQGLRSQFNVATIFEYVAKLGGADNIDQFKMPQMNMSVQPDETVQRQAEAGNVAPIPKSGTTPGIASAPGARMAGGL